MNKIGYLWIIEDKNRITNLIFNRKISNKKLHDIFYYLEIIYEKIDKKNKKDNEEKINLFLFFNYFSIINYFNM